MKKYLLFSAILFIAFFVLGINEVKAGTGENVSGWAWAEPNPDTSVDIGWISFNVLNCADEDPPGSGTYKSRGTPTDCPSAGTVIPNYGVNVNLSTGVFSGYAWSENIGWIQFNPAGPYPAAPNYSACLDLPGAGQACDGIGDYNVGGWARASAAPSGGWDGWIKLRGTNYGVSLNTSSNQFEDWAWGGDPEGNTGEEVVGWISFNCNNPETGNVCGVSDYKVFITAPLNQAPSATNPNDTQGNYCTTTCQNYPYVILGWTYSDLEGDAQNGYRVQVDNDGDFTAGIIWDSCPSGSGCSGGVSPDHAPPAGSGITFNTPYWWRVMVWDSNGGESTWSVTDSFTTGSRPPCVNFTFTPPSPSVGEIVNFTDQSTCYDADSTCNNWAWDFGDGTTCSGDGAPIGDCGSGTAQNPTHTYTTAEDYTVTLTATDSNGACPVSKPLTAASALPKWKEIAPTGWIEKLFAGLLQVLKSIFV